MYYKHNYVCIFDMQSFEKFMYVHLNSECVRVCTCVCVCVWMWDVHVHTLYAHVHVHV